MKATGRLGVCASSVLLTILFAGTPVFAQAPGAVAAGHYHNMRARLADARPGGTTDEQGHEVD